MNNKLIIYAKIIIYTAGMMDGSIGQTIIHRCGCRSSFVSDLAPISSHLHNGGIWSIPKESPARWQLICILRQRQRCQGQWTLGADVDG